jgi:hypothetical protein
MALKRMKKLTIVLVILAVLVAARLALPFFVTRYVNTVLAELPGYRGVIDGVHIHLIRGAYQIDSLKIFKVNGNEEIPFIDIPLTDLSVEWEALLDGKVVGEVKFKDPVLNFITAKKSEKGSESGGSQTGDDVDWTEPIKKLIPLKINRLTIQNGKIAFFDFSTKPQVDLFLTNVQLDAQNLNNATDQDEVLPSRVLFQARSIGNGLLSASMKINVLKQIPDLDVDLKFENVDMRSLNDFFGAYARIDVEKGTFNLYSEIAVLDGKLDGYIKPLFNDLKVVDWKKDKENPAELAWEAIAGFFLEVFENQPKNQFATRVPLEGNIAQVDSKFWPALWTIFSNAFVDALEHNTDDMITINVDGSKEPASELNAKEERKMKRKEKRDQKREERRARRESKKDREKSR